MNGSVFKRCTRKSCRAVTSRASCPKCGARSFRWYYAMDEQRRGEARRRRWSESFPNRKAAEVALRDELSRRDRGIVVNRSDDTVAAWFDDWYKRAKVDLRASTADGYGRIFDRYARAQIGGMKLQELRADHLNALYADLLREGGRGRRPLAPNSVRHLHIVMRRMLAAAVRADRVIRNVADSADPPKQTRPPDGSLGVWTGEQLAAFLEYVEGDRLAALWRILCSTGCRRGEAVGMRWEDVDLRDGRWSVRRALVTVNGARSWSEPKTAAGRRTIALDDDDIAALKAHRRRQLDERDLAGEIYRDEGLVFCHEDGQPLHPNVVTRWFYDAVERAGLPRIRLHDVRHSVVTAMLRDGVPVKVVSERAGHSSTSFTMDVYATVLPDMQRDAARRMGAILARKAVDPRLTPTDNVVPIEPSTRANVEAAPGIEPGYRDLQSLA